MNSRVVHCKLVKGDEAHFNKFKMGGGKEGTSRVLCLKPSPLTKQLAAQIVAVKETTGAPGAVRYLGGEGNDFYVDLRPAL